MYEDNLIVGKSLKLLFIGEILAAVSAVLGDSGLAGLASLAALILNLIALSMAAPTHPYFRTAFQVNIALIVLGVVQVILTLTGMMVLAILAVIAEAVLGVLNVYLICTAAGQFLTVNGYAALAAKGAVVWKLYLICSVAMMVFMVLILVPFVQIIAVFLVIGTTIAMLVGAILYMVFLYNAYHALLYGQ